MKKIVVIGGGISGLAAAHKLAKDGQNVILIESDSNLGGLGTFFKHGEKWIDKFYHCQMPSDNPLLKLIDEVGLKAGTSRKRTQGPSDVIKGRRKAYPCILVPKGSERRERLLCLRQLEGGA